MINIFIAAILGTILIVTAFFIEDRVAHMNPDNRFRKWWRKWLISDNPNIQNHKIEP